VDWKAAKAAIEEEWNEIVKKHNEAVVAWAAECQRLREEGVRAKDLPKKPKRPPKPKLPVEGPADDEDSATSSSLSDNDH
jgi:hypothetical protein